MSRTIDVECFVEAELQDRTDHIALCYDPETPELLRYKRHGIAPLSVFDPEITHERHGKIRVKPCVLKLYEKDRVEQCPQRSPVWYEKRRKHLTASQIASALGENPYDSKQSVIRKKVGLAPGFQGNEATEHGNRFESVAMHLYEERTGEKVLEMGLLESVLGSETDFLAGSPDGVTASGRLIEIKCPFRRKPKGVVPSYYMHQIQTLMWILDLEVCDFIEYVPETTWDIEQFWIVSVRRCNNFWARNLPKLQRFWDEVLEIQAIADTQGLDTADQMTQVPEPKTRPRKRKKPAEEACLIDI